LKKSKKEIIETFSTDEDQAIVEVDCNNDLNNYFFDIDYEWTSYALKDENRFFF
jgi:hypothetical protein